MHSKKSMKSISAISKLLLCLSLFLASATYSFAATPAGYSEYYIPGDESILGQVWADIGAAGAIAQTAARHTIISVVAWSPNTTIYYDHWEHCKGIIVGQPGCANGYNFDPNDPDNTADEKYVLANAGDSKIFESSNIPVNPRGTATYYDGRDHIYVAGGTVTVTRTTWAENPGTVFASAWEVYPVKPQMLKYILPFGDDLYGAPRNYHPFRRVFALIQATENNTVVTFDFNKDGVFGDTVCISHNNPCTQTATQVTLNSGEVFLLDRFAPFPTTGTISLPTGIVMQGTDTLQVNYIVGDYTANYEARGFSAFPSGLWDNEYYAPVPSDAGLNYPTQLYLFNPQSSALTINYQTSTTSGSFSVPAGQTRSFSEMTGNYVPAGSGVYLGASDVFWGVSTIDTNTDNHEWGYPLVPSFLLGNEHFFGWAPGAYANPILAANRDDSGIFITPVQDNTRVFVDRNNDGVVDYNYTLNRLQSQYVYDATDGDMSNSHIWATGPISIAYGQNPDTSPTGTPAIDLGYVSFPGGDFIDKVLTVKKSANPVVISTTAGAQSTYTLTVNSYHFPVDAVSIVDTLPAGWQYVNNSTSITLADMTTISGSAANPTLSGGNLILTWPSVMLGSMAPNQTITITFTAQTTQNFNLGDITRNIVKATGTRTVTGATQTFVASDFAFNSYGNLTVTKSSTAPSPLYPGNQFSYTVTVTNPSAARLNGVSVYDPLPDGLSYMAGSSRVTGTWTTARTDNVHDDFGSQAYYNNNGSVNWASDWTESDAAQSPTAGNVQITGGGELQLGSTSNVYRQVNLSGASSATLTLDYRTVNLDNGDSTYIEIATSPSGPWTTVLTFTNDQNGSVNYAIPPGLRTSTTTIRFRAVGYNGTNEYLYIDNVNVSYVHTSGTSAAGNAPNFVLAADGFYIDPGQALTLTFNVSVDNPLATGIDQITNTATINSNEIPLPLSASVTNLVVNPSSGSAEVGDRVWLDSDGDGVQDVGEPGLANVEVTLKNFLGATLMTTTTDATGHFLFTGVTPGNGYYVEITPGTLPSGLQQSAPTGHSDNRTNAFNLSAGQSYADADLGYKPNPGTAAIGNIVWSDANSNGVRDAGEPGIAGVTVQLYRDTNNNGIYDSGTDVLWGTTVTAADGSYLFTGVPASGTEDYFVRIDESQAKLSGYTRTAPTNNPLYVNNLSAGDVVQYANFGYHSNSTYSITDRVWFDNGSGGGTAGDGVRNGSEPGIALVTVALLDSSLNVIATTTTDANGYFTFSGVIGGGADYTIRITDTGGKLANYYGTTSSAISGTKQITNLAGNVDNSAAPSFGYNITRSIGDTVFNDNGSGGGIAGNGIQDGSEPGIAGVTVLLYLDDGDNVFEPGVGAGRDGNPITTLVTDSNGHYLFSGLADGTYWVSIDNTQAVLNGYNLLTTADDSGVAGHQRRVTLSGGVSQTGIDYGYRASTSYSASGTLWNDANNNGVNDSESGFGGVTIALMQGGNVIATTTTAANGTYSFTGLPSGTYTVQVTDQSGVLSSYIGTYEKTEGTTGPFNGQETVNLTSGNQTNVNFGYTNPIVPTLVVLSFFGAHEQDGQLVVEWETSSERNTLGFNLLRLDPATGNYEAVNSGLLPAMHTHHRGGSYSLVDRGASPGGVFRYKLVEVERNGKQNVYGPFTVSVERQNSSTHDMTKTMLADVYANADSANASDYTRKEKERSAADETLTKASMVSMQSSLASLKSQSIQVIGTRVKIPVREDGLYYLDANDIAIMLGMPRSAVVTMIGHTLLSMSNLGQPVAYLPAQNNSGIFFYGTGTDSAYTRDNIYWLDRVRGVTMQYEKGPMPAPATGGEKFTENLHVERDMIPNMSQTDNPAEDYWDWDLIFLSTFYSDPPKSFPFSLNGKADTQTMATLQVHLVGGSDTGSNTDHHVIVRLNDQQIGEDWWGGLNSYTLTATFDQSLLNEGGNTIEVQGVLDAGVPWSMLLIDSFDLTYKRSYVAADNNLFFKGDGNQAVTVSGFTTASSDILLFNVTNPLKPMQVAATISGSPGNFEISFRPISSYARYLAVSKGAVKKVASAKPANSSNLQARYNMADYLIIAPEELLSAVKTLADYRKSQGMTTMVVKLDDIMNEFNFGLSSPEAIKTFLTYAYKNWVKAPRYVVLAGEGTWDYRDNLGAGGSLIPPAMVSTPYGLATSDNHLADVNGDHVPEMAIGRLPVLTPEEVQRMVSKIKSFENTASRRAVIFADRPDDGGNFTLDSEAISALFPPAYTLEKVYLADLSFDVAKTMLSAYLNGGSLFFNYIGHGSFDSLSKTSIFANTNWYPDALLVDSLSNGSGLPIMAAMTCAVGEFAVPAYPSLSQSMVLKADGGAAAVWSPTTLSDNEEAKLLNTEFYKAFFVNGKKVLGDAVLQSLSKYKLTGSMPFMTEVYGILGDPALRIK